MILSQKVNILWVTDIHFSFLYEDIKDPRFGTFISAFVDSVEKNHNRKPIDYILLSGDLAQMGLNVDYLALKKLLLDKLFSRLKACDHPIPKVLTIPGNHDVLWKKGAFFDDYIKYINTEKKKAPSRPVYLEEKEDKFRGLFAEYSEFIKNEKAGNFKEFYKLPTSDSFEVSDEYDESRLFGHIIDRKKKLILIFLNSAWFSMGDGFNPVYIDHINKKNKGGKVTDENLKTWLETKDYLTEYNKQISGVQLLFKKHKDKLDYYFDNYPDYFVATIMHHSKNWLEWSESFSYEKGEETSAFQMKRITENSNVFLTGHEHVPIDTEGERAFGRILHLKGGCFLEYNQVERLKEKKESQKNYINNWFSILNIDTTSKNIEEQRFHYNINDEQWRSYEAPIPYSTAREFEYILTDTRKQAIIDAYNKGDTNSLKSYLEAYFNIELQKPDLVKVFEPKSKEYQLFLMKREGQSEFCIVVKKAGLFSNFFSSEVFANQLIDKLDKYDNVLCVRFLVLDLFIDGNLQENYKSKEFVREHTFGRLVILADNLFDVARFSFFMKWEPEKKGEKNPDSKFSKYYTLKFINQIIPYWLCERFWL